MTQEMEIPSKVLEQIAFNTRPIVEEHLLVVMDRSIIEEHLAQPLQTNDKLFKIAVNFSTGYNGNFNVPDKNNNFVLPNQFLMKMASYKVLYHQVHKKSKI